MFTDQQNYLENGYTRKAIYRFSAIPIKIPIPSFSTEILKN
jgi:hypothetical protein